MIQIKILVLGFLLVLFGCSQNELIQQQCLLNDTIDKNWNDLGQLNPSFNITIQFNKN